MAQKVLVQFVDDLDGSVGEDVSTVSFSLDGVSYEIDLREVNANKLRKSLQDFVESARRTGGRIKRGVTPAQVAAAPARPTDARSKEQTRRSANGPGRTATTWPTAAASRPTSLTHLRRPTPSGAAGGARRANGIFVVGGSVSNR